MTLVQNLPLLLNGSKIKGMAAFLIFCLLTNCGVVKTVPSNDTLDYGTTERDPIHGNKPTASTDDKAPTTTSETNTNTIEWSDTTIVINKPTIDTSKIVEIITPAEVNVEEIEEEIVTELEEIPITKDGYKVVVMLPFFTNKFSTYGSINKDSKMALEFYEGAKMAFDRLRGEGVALDVTVLDTKGDVGTVQYLLQTSEVLDADLIIGPVTKDNSRLVAEFARNNRKTMVSPLNRRGDIAKQNPFYVQVNPTLNTHFVELLSYIYKSYGSTSNALIIAPAGRTGQQRMRYWQQANFIANQSASVPPLKSMTFDPKSAGNVELDLETYLTKGAQNIVIIPSSSESFVNFMMRELSPLRHDYPMVVLGMHYWEHFEKVDYGYYENLKVHISSEYYVNKNDSQYRSFKRQYFDNYGANPSETVLKGYDTMLFFSRMMTKYGVYPQNHLANESARYMHTTFAITPKFSSSGASETGGAVSTYENSYINILKFEDFQFRKVN